MRLSVLVVDDDPTVRGVISTLLGFDGVEVTTADDGPSALSTADRIDPDVVLLDLHLPGMSGAEVCRALKERGAEVPVVMVTGSAGAGDEVARAAGADAFLRKPFSPVHLIDVVRTTLNGKGSLLG